ncbi:MAG: hypothetical protein WD824_26085 [Cyclobacteriaceae bacterium]
MARAIVILFWCCCITAQAQVRVNKLVIQPHETFYLDSTDILVADSLIMMDSSRIKLNGLKAENFIRTNVAIIGNYCRIDGRGVPGKKSADGTAGLTPIGPCRDGVAGRNGLRGLSGGSGTNLFLYIDKIHIKGKLIIDLSGGNGGDGGNGGEGGGGSPGTHHCNGGEGGNGGNGGAGGDGGRGGVLTIGGRDAVISKASLGNLLIVKNNGGSFGYGGICGAGGQAGLGPNRKNGKAGDKGTDGLYGRPGDSGTVLLEEQ